MSADAAAPTPVRWYHWSALSAVCALMIALGALELMQGADSASRFFLIDTWVVRVLGLGLVVCAFWLPLRHDRAFVASMWVLGLSMLENLVTYRFESSAMTATTDVALTLIVFMGLPILILAELRPIFRADTQQQPV
jgi:hypothetical protein